MNVNVARSASPPPGRQAKVRVPTAFQVRAVLAAADRRDPILGRMVMLAALTGARRGEVCALRWCDVDLDGGLLTIAHSILDLPGRVELKDTKSHAERVLALDPAAVAMLTLHRDVEQRAARCENAILPNGFVFSDHSLDGSALVVPTALRRSSTGSATTSATASSPSTVSDTFLATQLAACGDVTARTLAGRLGHADASVTMRVYAAFFPAADIAAAAHTGRVLSVVD